MPEDPAVRVGPARRVMNDVTLALTLLVVAAAFRLPRLGFPPDEVFDEVYHAKAAFQLFAHEPPTEWVHPPTAKLLIAAGVWLGGYVSWAWRLAPALAGIALAPVFFFLARRVLPTQRAALIASVLLLCDGVYLVQSRIAMTNIFAVLFQVAAALFIVRSALEDRLPVSGMALGGLFLGLALSTRWTSLWAASFLGLVLLAVRRVRLFRPRELALTFMAFAAIPFALYVLSYVPWMGQSYGSVSHPLGFGDLWTLQKDIWRYHANLDATHPYFSKWYTWPWLWRPTWYYFQQIGDYDYGIVALGNPALWWASVPVTLWALVSGASSRDPRRLFSGLGFACLYLPWGISPRTLNYSHYLFEAIPYACLSLGLLLDRFWDHPVFKQWTRSYVALVVVLFFFFLPFLVALPVPPAWYYARIGGVGPWTWFATWI